MKPRIVYYQEFIKQRQNDPEQAELVKTRERVQKILADLAVLQGAGQFSRLYQPSVIDDLQLSAIQREQLDQLAKSVQKNRDETFNDFRKLTPEKRRNLFLDQARNTDAGVRRILTESQLNRLNQINLQMQGPSAFRDSKIAAELQLTTEQREQIRAIEEEMFYPGPPPERRGGPGEHRGGPRGDFRKDRGQRLIDANERVAKILTPEQLNRWNEMIGKKFSGPMFGRGPGEHGGGPGEPPDRPPRDR